ncbi:SMI1/KNR4 family protein [Metabacillus bambusae]|uniref:SMI1/KNR4 family protein n=1 Tax=Metabacillus bambusae TaxID=2795218 RepID=A0ABS3MZM9_9BACI|nr:SMI1/KNR4 family protein [Metabacillus bambusae]MBO1511370.1 SMI1/KNR4 family protein [Metabacillus bambusae]
MKKVINMINSSSKVAGVSLLDLKKTEKALGAIFPDEYKELFLETNGAKFGDWILFPILTNKQSTLTIDIIKQNRDNRPKDVPNEMICIGENINGDKLCYRIRKRFMQELIFLWNEKTGISDCKASTLSQFIDWYVPKVNTNKPKTVGTFTVESGKVIVTDPCYQVDEEEDLQIILSNVKNGNWTASITYSDEEVVESLLVFYGEKKPSGKWHVCDKPIAVDSAQAGIFDLAGFGRDEVIQYEVKNVYDIEIEEVGLKYYVACCDMVASDAQGGVVPGGAISMSGYGDGMYEVKVKYNISKEVVGVMIDFGDKD